MRCEEMLLGCPTYKSFCCVDLYQFFEAAELSGERRLMAP